MKLLAFLILVLGVFSSCDKLTGKSNDDRSAQTVPDPIPVPPPPPPLPHPEPPPPIAETLPEVSFAFAEWVYEGANQVHLELNLSKASTETVSVDILLIDGTALYPDDYIGFSGSSANDLKIIVQIPPGTTRFDVPALLIPDGASCDIEFTAMLNKDTVEKAVVVKENTLIKMPCM